MSWNSLKTDVDNGMRTGLINLKGYNGDTINAHVAAPVADGKYAGIVLVMHMPGWDELYREFARRFADHGYSVVCPNLYARAGQGAPDDIAAVVRGAGGVADDQVVGDLTAGRDWLKAQSNSNGKVGIVGTCSGGRHAYLTACRGGGFDAVIDLWGGGVVQTPEQLNEKRPVAPLDYTKDLACPLLGLFGNDDQGPSPAQVDLHEAELKRLGKNYEFHRYDGAGHAFFYHDRPAYRQVQAMDGWAKVFAFFEANLQK